MSHKYKVVCNYVASTVADIELPCSWDNIVDAYVKWGQLNVILKDDTALTFDVGDVAEVDTKRPIVAEVYGGEKPNWAEPVATIE